MKSANEVAITVTKALDEKKGMNIKLLKQQGRTISPESQEALAYLRKKESVC